MDHRPRGAEPEDLAAALLARLNAGEVSQDQLALASHLGYPPARMILPETSVVTLREWVRFFERFEDPERLASRIALALAELVLSENPELVVLDTAFSEAIKALTGWLAERETIAAVSEAAEAVWVALHKLEVDPLTYAAAETILCCIQVPDHWPSLEEAFEEAEPMNVSHFEDKDPPSEALLCDLSASLGPWALKAKLTRRMTDSH